MLNPVHLSRIPCTPSLTLFTAIWLLYSSPLSKASQSLPMCMSAGSITSKCPSVDGLRKIVGYSGLKSRMS